MNNVTHGNTGLANSINVNGEEFRLNYLQEGEKVRMNFRLWEQTAAAIADQPQWHIGQAGPIAGGFFSFIDLPSGVTAEVVAA